MNFDTASINEKIYQLMRERIIFGEEKTKGSKKQKGRVFILDK